MCGTRLGEQPPGEIGEATGEQVDVEHVSPGEELFGVTGLVPQLHLDPAPR